MATEAQKKAYIEKAKIAVLANVQPGLFPSVAVGQSALESGWGLSGLSAKYQNYFGIKASKGWTGKTSVMQTIEFEKGVPVKQPAGFRVYDSLQDSIADRNRFLSVNSRYAKYGVFAAKTPEDQAKALQTAGYATDPDYAQKIIAIINQFNLKELDGKAAVLLAEKSKKKN